MPENQQKQLHQTVIPVTIRNKVATAPLDAQIVCDNDNYVILFDFDEEWSGIEYKVARFAYNEQCIDVLFTGNEVRVPVLKCTSLVGIGVYTNNIKTSTPAFVKCISSALSFDDCGNKEPPTYEEYTKIIEILNKMHADFVFKQDKVDNALVTADKTVVGAINELKANIDTEVANTGKITKFSYGITTKEEFTTENLAKMSGAVLVKGVPFEFQENITVKVPDTVTEIHFVDTTLGWNTLIQGNGKSRIVGAKGHAELVGFGSVINCEAEYIRNSTNIQGCKSSYISDSSFLNNCEADSYSNCTYVDVNTCKRYINEANGQVQILNGNGEFEYRAIQDGDKAFALMEDVNRVTAETDKKLIKKADITYVDSKVASTYTPKGSKQNYSDLNLIPLENRRYGDIYNIINETIITDAQGVETYYAPGTNFVWAKADGTTHTVDFWDALGGNYAELVKLISQNTNKIQDIDEKKLGKTEAEETYVAKDTGVSTADEIAGLYGKDQYGDTYVYPASTRPTDWSAVIRDDKGWARVNTPEDRDNQDPDIAANKGYVKDSFATKKTVQDLDNKKLDKTEAESIYADKSTVKDLDDRLSFVEGATNEYLADKSTAVIKQVPVGAYKKAIVSEIGGKTRKSENLFDEKAKFNNYSNIGITLTWENGKIHATGQFDGSDDPLQFRFLFDITPDFAVQGWQRLQIYGTSDFMLYDTNFSTEASSYAFNPKDLPPYVDSISITLMLKTTDKPIDTYFNIGWTKGKDEKPYEPYFNGLSDTKTKAVVSHFANIWDEQWELGVYSTGSGKPMQNNLQIRNKNIIRVFPNTTYTRTAHPVTDKESTAIWILEYDENKNYLHKYYARGIIDGYTFTTSSNAHYINFYFVEGYKNYYSNDLSIVLGKIIPSYTPYREPITYPIPTEIQSLKGYGVGAGTYSNTLDLVNKSFATNIEEYVFDGTEPIIANASQPDKVVFAVDIKNKGTVAFKGYENKDCLSCDKLTPIESGTSIPSLPIYSIRYSGYKSQFTLIFPLNTTVEEVKNYIKGMKINYLILETTKIDISQYLKNSELPTVEVEGGGYLEFVTEPTVPNAPKDVPSEVQYIVHKGGVANA